MFFTFTLGMGASSAGAAAAEALVAGGATSATAETDGAAGIASAVAVADGGPGAGANSLFAGTAVDVVVPAFDAAADPSGADAPEQATIEPINIVAPQNRRNRPRAFMLCLIPVFLNSSVSPEVFSRPRCADRVFR